MEDMDLNVGRDFFNANCVLGSFDNRKNGVLYSGTLDEIKSETIKLINTVGKKVQYWGRIIRCQMILICHT